jgi:hypothetical protein
VLSDSDRAELRVVLEELGLALVTVELAPADRAEAEADLKTIEAQLSAPTPKRGIVRTSLESVQRICESAIASGAAPEVGQAIEKLAHGLGGLV